MARIPSLSLACRQGSPRTSFIALESDGNPTRFASGKVTTGSGATLQKEQQTQTPALDLRSKYFKKNEKNACQRPNLLLNLPPNLTKPMEKLISNHVTKSLGVLRSAV